VLVVESATWATPHDAEDTVAADAFVLPTEVNVVVALELDALDSAPEGTGEPLVHVPELELTVPPEPLPVE